MDLMIESFPRLLNATILTIELTLLSLFFGIFGTTVNAAFVDESTSCFAKFFVDEDPRRSQGLFRGKEVRSLEKLTNQDRIYFPYDENLRQKILRRTNASLLQF